MSVEDIKRRLEEHLRKKIEEVEREKPTKPFTRRKTADLRNQVEKLEKALTKADSFDTVRLHAELIRTRKRYDSERAKLLLLSLNAHFKKGDSEKLGELLRAYADQREARAQTRKESKNYYADAIVNFLRPKLFNRKKLRRPRR